MLYLITGPNGGGKTLRSIVKMHELRAQGLNVYAHGYHGLKLGWVDQTLDPRDWKQMPPGSVMFVDEAQKVWRTRRGNKEPPQELYDMEEHRYQGIDIYLISQDPSYLDSHIKGLVHKHWHCIPHGNKCSRVFEFNECQDNTKSMIKRANAQFTVWDHPVKHYDDYESAMVHLDKPKIPWRQRLGKPMLYGGILGCAVIMYLLIWGPTPKASASEGGGVPAAQRASSLFGNGVGIAAAAPVTPEGWLAAHSPLVPAFPVSAPVYAGRSVQDYPRPYCMASGVNGSESCTCLTQQGTKYDMDLFECVRLAHDGPAFDPYLPKAEASGTAIAPLASDKASMGSSAVPPAGDITLDGLGAL